MKCARILNLLLISSFLLFYMGTSSAYFSYNTKWIPNPTILGGLNTEITLTRFFSFDYVKLQNQTFYASFNSSEYWLNVTSGNNVKLRLNNWFDSFGISLSVDKACSMTLFTGTKGTPSQVNGQASYTYFAGNQTINLVFSQAGYSNIHYGSGSTIHVSNPDQIGFFHSQDSPRGYKTAYGFGIVHAGYYQYGFQVRTYTKNGESDINTVRLQLGNNVTYEYYHGTHIVNEISDPYHYCEIAGEWYRINSPSAWVKWDPTTKYLDVGFNIYFLETDPNRTMPSGWFPKYEPKLTNQNCTATITSDIEGTISNEQPGIFYVGLADIAYNPPVSIPWELSYFLIGMGGCFLMMFGTMYGVWKIKHDEIPEGIGWGVVLFLIGASLLIVWLWQ